VNYRLLIELTKIFKENRNERVMKKLVDYGVIKEEGNREIEKLIEIAGNYSDEFDEQEKIEVELNDISKKALSVLVTALQEEEEPEDIQNTIYQIAKANEVQPKDFFKILYQIILGTSRGPKIGPFITDIGRKQVAKTLSEYL
jgi:lysyl-tRNA synthetase class 1